MDPPPNIPTLVASTANAYSCSIGESRNRERALQDIQSQRFAAHPPSNTTEDEQESNYFKSAQWCSPTPSPHSNSSNKPQVPRRNHPPNIQRRQYPPNIHPPPSPSFLSLPNNTHALHHPLLPNTCKQSCAVPAFLPPRYIHNALPLLSCSSSHSSYELPVYFHDASVYLQSYFPNDGSIPHALVPPLVELRKTFFDRD